MTTLSSTPFSLFRTWHNIFCRYSNFNDLGQILSVLSESHTDGPAISFPRTVTLSHFLQTFLSLSCWNTFNYREDRHCVTDSIESDIYIYGSRDNAFGIATGYGLDEGGVGV
jgi:hypothetical protein